SSVEVRETFRKKPGRKMRRMARPVRSFPREKRNVAPAPCLFKIASSRGTPSRVPRYVSTSTLSASFTPGRGSIGDELAGFGDVRAVGVEDAPEGVGHVHLRLPAEVPHRVVDLGHAALHVLISGSVVGARRRLDEPDAGGVFAIL